MRARHTPGATACPDCGGTLSRLGEDLAETLEYVPVRFLGHGLLQLLVYGSQRADFTQRGFSLPVLGVYVCPALSEEIPAGRASRGVTGMISRQTLEDETG